MQASENAGGTVSHGNGVVAAIATATIVGIGFSLTIPLLSFGLEEKGANGTLIGLNTAVGGLATIVLAPFVPSVAAQIGVQRLLVGSLLIGALALVAFPYTDPLWLWFPLRFLVGASLTVLFVLSEFWIVAAAPENRRGLLMGVYATTLSIGFAAGPALLALVGTRGIPPYVLGALLFVLACGPVLLAGRQVPVLDERPHAPIISVLLGAPSATLAAFAFGAVESGMMAFVPLYGVRLGYSEVGGAFLLSLTVLGNIFTQIPLGWVSDRMDRRKLLLAIAVIGTAGAALLPLTAPMPLLFQALIFLWGGTVAGLYTVGLAHLGARYTGSALAQANAAFLVCYSTGMLAGPPLLGFGMDTWDPHGLMAATAALLGAYAILVALRLRRAPGV